MLHKLTVKNFRCFQDMQLEFENFNLISGKNNVGKTALLEAIFLHLGSQNPELPSRLNLFRNHEFSPIDPDETWGWLFYNKDIENPIEISSLGTDKIERVLKISITALDDTLIEPSGRKDDGLKFSSREEPVELINIIHNQQLQLDYKENTGKILSSYGRISTKGLILQSGGPPPFPTSVYLSSKVRPTEKDVERFSKIEEVNKQEVILHALKKIEPNLKRLAIHYAGGFPSIRGDMGTGRMIPMSFIGEGTSKLLSILLAISIAPNAVVLVDEIENGFHHSVLKDVWLVISQLARNMNTQIIATTHSLECIKAAYSAFSSEGNNDFCLHRLDRFDSQIIPVTFNQKTLGTSIDMDLEVR